jgi:hypothetical protein
VFGKFWSATIYQSHPDGKSTPIEQKHFFEDKDAAFEWAISMIVKREG